jgi:hypothetical protein
MSVDAALSRHRIRLISALLDEVAHVQTGMAILAVWSRPGRGFAGGLLAGSVLLDLDHVPELLGIRILRTKGLRPAPHSLGTLLLLLGAARAGSQVAAGTAAGVAGHLVRDLATGTNRVPLLWPLSKKPFAIPYPAYAAAFAALAGAGAATRGRTGYRQRTDSAPTTDGHSR